jgi:hypothetical protein
MTWKSPFVTAAAESPYRVLSLGMTDIYGDECILGNKPMGAPGLAFETWDPCN